MQPTEKLQNLLKEQALSISLKNGIYLVVFIIAIAVFVIALFAVFISLFSGFMLAFTPESGDSEEWKTIIKLFCASLAATIVSFSVAILVVRAANKLNKMPN